MSYNNISTVNDVMKESLIYGAELDGKYGFPVLKCTAGTPKDTIDFKHSLRLNKVKHLNINFFIHDTEFLSVWNNPDKYMEHFRCFDSICGLDFTIDVNSPLALQIYNKYRNHVLTWYFQNNGIKIIPKVDILPGCSDWIYDGLPRNSTLCCSTNGRARNKCQIEEFKHCFEEMENILKPRKILIYGAKIDLDSDSEIVYYKTQIQKREKNLDCAKFTV